MLVCSLLFPSVSGTLPLHLLCISVNRVRCLLQCRVSTVIQVLQQLAKDSGQGKQCQAKQRLGVNLNVFIHDKMTGYAVVS